MNTLSIFIYLIDILTSLEVFIAICVSASIVAIGISYLATYGDKYPSETAIEHCTNVKNTLLPYIIGGVFLLVLIPSPKTMYLIGASEIAEVTIQTEEINKVRQIINKKLDDLLEEQK